MAAKKSGTATLVHVTAPKGGRRRGGRRWDEGVTDIPLEDLGEEALAQLEADPDFDVQVIEGEATKTKEPAPKNGAAKAAGKKGQEQSGQDGAPAAGQSSDAGGTAG